MNKEKIPKTTTERVKEKFRKILKAIKDFFADKEKNFDESRRNIFKSTLALTAGAALSSSGTGGLVGLNHQISEKEFKDVVTLLVGIGNGSDDFLLQLFKYFSRHKEEGINFKQRFSGLFRMDEKVLNDHDFSMLIHNFQLPGNDFDFELIERIFNNEKLVEQLDLEENIVNLIKSAVGSGKFSGSVNDFIKEEFAKPLFSEAEGFISRISQNGLERINPAEQEFLKQLPSYIDSRKFVLSKALGLEKVVELENQVKSINFALNPEAFLNQATNEEMQDLFKNREYIATKDAIFSKKYACVKMFAYKALSEGRQIILSAVGAQDKVFVLSEKTEFGEIFNRLKEFSPAAVVKATRTSSAGELSIKR